MAYIHVKAGSDEITQSDITNMVGTSSCPYVTGLLQILSIDNIVSQWQDEWTRWFESVRGALDEDVAGNLYNRIDQLQGWKSYSEYRCVTSWYSVQMVEQYTSF